MRKSLVIAVVILLLVLGGGTVGAAYYYGQENRVPEGFAVGGLQAGGQSPSLALTQLQKEMEAWGETKVTALPEDSKGVSEAVLPSRTLKQLGLKMSAGEAVRALERYRDRGWWERAISRWQKEPGLSYPVSVGWDEAVLEKEAANAWGAAADVMPVDAIREINGRDEVVYTPEVDGMQVDLPALTANIKRLVPVSLGVGANQPKTVRLPVTGKAPAVTVASLKDEGIERKIAEFTTSFTTSAAGRTHNVTVTAKALNDTLLQPDQVFEYGKIVDKADKEYGYRAAPVIVQGKLTDGIGGGICQVSSTLYNAILQVGLDVVERRNHSLAVHYLPRGLDATFADGNINFRFRNSTGKQLLIRTVVHDKQLTVKLFGSLADNVSYKTETQEVKVVPPNTKFVADNTLAAGKQKRLQKGVRGYIVDTFRIKLVDGKEVDRDKMPRSNYRAQDELIAVNPADPRLKPKNTAPVPTPAPAGQDAPVEPV